MIKKLIQLKSCKTVSKTPDGFDIVEITLVKPLRKVVSSLDSKLFLKGVTSIWLCEQGKNITHFIDVDEDMKVYLNPEYFLDISKPKVNMVEDKPVVIKHPKVWIVERPFVDMTSYLKHKRIEDIIREGRVARLIKGQGDKPQD
jgi:hypothetical protein